MRTLPPGTFRGPCDATEDNLSDALQSHAESMQLPMDINFSHSKGHKHVTFHTHSEYAATPNSTSGTL